MDDYDITGKIGDLYPGDKPEWPMYSFSRPAWILWNAIGAELTRKGWKEREVKDWLQSKFPRWALDDDLGDAIAKLGKEYAEKISKVK